MNATGPGLPKQATSPGDDGAPASERPSEARTRIRWWAAPILVTILFVVLQPLLGSGWALFPDSYRYAKQAERILGADAEQAHRAALDAFCGSRASYAFRPDGTAGTWVVRSVPPAERTVEVTACLEKYGAAGDVTTLDPRYQSIFTTRPGYPLVAAPFIAAFGIEVGMRILGLVIAAAGGLVTYVLLRFAGLTAVPSAIGQIVYLVSPLGWWAMQALGEGLVDLCVLGAATGLVAIRSGRTRAGLAVMAASWLALGVVRFSSLLLIAAAMAVACILVALGERRDGRRPLFAAAAVCAAASVGTIIVMSVFGLPGASVTLQDTFTRHFADPLVPDPWRMLLSANGDFWPSWLGTPSASWVLAGCVLAGSAALAIWRRDLLWPALALFAAGAAQIAAHPLPQEAGRLGLLMWIPATFGAAVLATGAVRRLRPTPVDAHGVDRRAWHRRPAGPR